MSNKQESPTAARLIALRNSTAGYRIKPCLSATHVRALLFAGVAYQTAAQRPVSQSLLIRRAVELLAERANAMQADPALAAAEVVAVGAARTGGGLR